MILSIMERMQPVQSERIPREQRREVRMEQIMQKRHLTAVAALRLEDALVESEKTIYWEEERDFVGEIKALLEESIAHLPKNAFGQDMRQRYRKCLDNYFEHVRESVFVSGALTRTASMQEAPLRKPTTQEREARAGRTLFLVRVGRFPDGDVFVRQEHGCFFVSFANEDDYTHFKRDKSEELFEQDKSEGCFMKDVPLYFPSEQRTLNATLIPINGTENTSPHYNQARKHEMQHFVNHSVYGFFSDVAPNIDRSRVSQDGSFHIAMDEVKDELLAWMRDGSEAFTIDAALCGSSYANLLQRLPFPDQKKIRAMVNVIRDGLHRSALWRVGGLRGRALLANHFLDIPLDRIPTWLGYIDRYYAKWIDAIAAYDAMPDVLPINMIAGDASTPMRHGYYKNGVALLHEECQHLAQVRLGICGHNHQDRALVEHRTWETIRDLRVRLDEMHGELIYGSGHQHHLNESHRDEGSELIQRPRVSTTSSPQRSRWWRAGLVALGAMIGGTSGVALGKDLVDPVIAQGDIPLKPMGKKDKIERIPQNEQDPEIQRIVDALRQQMEDTDKEHSTRTRLSNVRTQDRSKHGKE